MPSLRVRTLDVAPDPDEHNAGLRFVDREQSMDKLEFVDTHVHFWDMQHPDTRTGLGGDALAAGLVGM